MKSEGSIFLYLTRKKSCKQPWFIFLIFRQQWLRAIIVKVLVSIQYHIVENTMNTGHIENKDSGVNWLMKTGHNKSAPSEVIHLFSMAQQ